MAKDLTTLPSDDQIDRTTPIVQRAINEATVYAAGIELERTITAHPWLRRGENAAVLATKDRLHRLIAYRFAKKPNTDPKKIFQQAFRALLLLRLEEARCTRAERVDILRRITDRPLDEAGYKAADSAVSDDEKRRQNVK